MRWRFLGGMLVGVALFGAIAWLLRPTRPTRWSGTVAWVRAHAVAQAELDTLTYRAGILPVRLLESPAIIGAYADREVVTGDPIVVADAWLIHEAEPAMRRGVLAHEVGHHAAGHIGAGWRTLTYVQRAALQREADAYGMRLIGEDGWRSYLRSLGMPAPKTDEAIADLRTVPVRLPAPQWLQ